MIAVAFTRTRSATRDAAVAGVRAVAPMAVALVPFGLAIGATIADSSLDPWPNWTASFLVFAGSAQFAMVDMVSRGEAPVMVVLTALLINLRFAAYGGSMARWFGGTSRRCRAALAFTLVDQTYLATANDAAKSVRTPAERVAFFVGSSTYIGLIWIGSQTVGLVAGASLPSSLDLGVAAPISLCGLLASSAKTTRAVEVAVVSAAVVLLGSPLIGPGALVVAIAAATSIGSTKKGEES